MQQKDNSIATVRIRLPDEILQLLDQLIDRGLYTNRSEAIRDFARQYVVSHGGAHA